ncbi:MAG: hypothetical protein FJ044_00675 [Candidatus Cloacimonetes bacterium]|nr:hypothetical protein [Candidatus Cloacimonadota bacterium]
MTNARSAIGEVPKVPNSSEQSQTEKPKPSETLKVRISDVRRELERLESLAARPPELPQGHKIARVVGTDSAAAKYDKYLPEYDDLVVLPDYFNDEVWVYGDSRGNTITHSDGRVWTVGYGWDAFGKSPEEAISAFQEHPGEYYEDNK